MLMKSAPRDRLLLAAKLIIIILQLQGSRQSCDTAVKYAVLQSKAFNSLIYCRV